MYKFKVGDKVNVIWIPDAEEISGIPESDIRATIENNPWEIKGLEPDGWYRLVNEYYGFCWPPSMLVYVNKRKWRM